MLKDLDELLQAGIISQETAGKIEDYYSGKKENPGNKLLAVFGVLGALLVGLGIILIIAHNWDNLSRTIKITIAFIPLVIGQLLCGYTILNKKENLAWKESTSTFLFFAVATAIALISQIYNIGGLLSSFLLTWMLLCIPIVYIMNSSVASLLYIIGITWYTVETFYFHSHHTKNNYYYWVLLALIIPYYYKLYKHNAQSNFMQIHNWLIPLSVTICLGSVGKNNEEFLFIAYISLFGLFYNIGNSNFIKKQQLITNGYINVGSIGTVALLTFLSFYDFWKHIHNENPLRDADFTSAEFITSLIITIAAIIALLLTKPNKNHTIYKPIHFAFLLFIPIFFLGYTIKFSAVLINILVLFIGVMTVIRGSKINNFVILNYGLFIITILITCRFFDTNLSFALRGILFVLIGIGFFVANYQMIKKNKKYVQ